MSDRPHLASGSIGQFGGRVGHKAAGFISKKFFHPSNYKNQEKLWAAIEAKKEEEKRQEELSKKREEERRVELLMKEMKASGRGSTSEIKAGLQMMGSSTLSIPQDSLSHEEKESMNETKRRLALLQSSAAESEPLRINVKSRYPEDVHENGHVEIWGSFFDLETKRWGFACCKSTERASKCPMAEASPKRRKER